VYETGSCTGGKPNEWASGAVIWALEGPKEWVIHSGGTCSWKMPTIA